MARSTAAVDVKATRYAKRLRQREGARKAFPERVPLANRDRPEQDAGIIAFDTRELDSEGCADADGHQVASAPATVLTQMKGNSHLLVLKELRQQRQVCQRPVEAGSYPRARRALLPAEACWGRPFLKSSTIFVKRAPCIRNPRKYH